jgi:hypothetical protein
MAVKLTILIIIAIFGLMIPLFWLIGTATSIPVLWREMLRATRKEPTVVLNPELGLTMADGGGAIDKEKKD